MYITIKFPIKLQVDPSKINQQPIHKQEPILTKRQTKIIALLEEFQELTALSIQEKLMDHKITTRTLRDDLIFLKKHNMICSRGRGKNAFWFKASM